MRDIEIDLREAEEAMVGLAADLQEHDEEYDRGMGAGLLVAVVELRRVQKVAEMRRLWDRSGYDAGEMLRLMAARRCD